MDRRASLPAPPPPFEASVASNTPTWMTAWPLGGKANWMRLAPLASSSHPQKRAVPAPLRRTTCSLISRPSMDARTIRSPG